MMCDNFFSYADKKNFCVMRFFFYISQSTINCLLISMVLRHLIVIILTIRVRINNHHFNVD